MDDDAGNADMPRLDRDVRHAMFSMDVLERCVGRNGAGRAVLMGVAGGRQNAEHGDNADDRRARRGLDCGVAAQ